MQHDAQGIFTEGGISEEPKETPIRKGKRSYCKSSPEIKDAKERRKIILRRYDSKPESRARRKIYLEENKDKIQKWRNEYKRNRRSTDPVFRERDTISRQKSWAKYKEIYKQRRRLKQSDEKYREQIRQKTRHRWATDPQFRLRSLLGYRTRMVFARAEQNKPSSTRDLVGCTWSELKIYMESQFRDGMNWSNWGTLWEVDHIVPFMAVDLFNPEHVRKVCHYTNLRPLEAVKNRSKGARITEEVLLKMNEMFSLESEAA